MLRKMFRMPQRRLGAALGVSVTAIALALTVTAVAQSSRAGQGGARDKPASVANGRDDLAQGVRARSPVRARASQSSYVNATLSNNIAFVISAPAQGYFAQVYVDGADGTAPPAFIYNRGWSQVTRVGPGHYCLNGAGYNYPAVVSVARAGTALAGIVTYDHYGYGCPGVGVYTYSIGSING
jgi:hypothetical protein